MNMNGQQEEIMSIRSPPFMCVVWKPPPHNFMGCMHGFDKYDDDIGGATICGR